MRKFTKWTRFISDLPYLERLAVMDLEPLELRRIKSDLTMYGTLKFSLHYRQTTSNATTGPYPEQNFGVGFGNEAPQATRPRRRRRRGGGKWGGVSPSPAD